MARASSSNDKPFVRRRAPGRPKAEKQASSRWAKSADPASEPAATKAQSGSAPQIDWDSLSLEAVNGLIAAAEARRAALRREAEQALRAEFEAKAASFGLTLADIVGPAAQGPGVPGKGRRGARAGQAEKTPAAIRFRGPNGETWSGRGPTPRWLKALEANGKPRGDFAV